MEGDRYVNKSYADDVEIAVGLLRKQIPLPGLRLVSAERKIASRLSYLASLRAISHAGEFGDGNKPRCG